jgi:hypothetical protein
MRLVKSGIDTLLASRGVLDPQTLDGPPFRVVVDPASDGAVVSYAVIDRMRVEFLHRVGFADLMQPKDIDAT